MIALVTTALAIPLQKALERVLDDPALAGASVSVSFGPPAAPVAAVDPDRRVVPASVTKLLTAAVVADTLGLDAVLETPVYLAGVVADGVLVGDLVVVGGGDPSLGATDPAAPLRAVRAAVEAAHVTVVTGAVVADPSRFDGPAHGQGWMWDDLGAPWSPAISGLPYALGLAPPGVDGVACQGREGVGTPVLDPAACFAEALTAELERAGIDVQGAPRVAQAASTERPLLTLRSPPVRDLVRDMLHRSDNLYAESLWRLAGGRDAVATRLLAAGSQDPAPADGSGLSRYSLLSARTLTQVTAWIDGRPWGPELRSLLPTAGRTGTLASRFAGTVAVDRVVAKTGSMTGVRNLVGWITAADGETLPFAVCFVGFVAPQGEVIAVQDRVVALAAGSARGRVPRSALRDPAFGASNEPPTRSRGDRVPPGG